jgi:hypothetical protein
MSKLTFPKKQVAKDAADDDAAAEKGPQPFEFMAQHRLVSAPDILNPYVPCNLQPLQDECFDRAWIVDVQEELFTRIVTPIVAKRLEELRGASRGLDYRAYSINFDDEEVQRVMFGEPDRGSPEFAQGAKRQRLNALRSMVEEWTYTMLQQYAAAPKSTVVFRRSLVVCFGASFCNFGEYSSRGAHAITLALETRTPDLLRLLIFDHQTNGYRFTVHEQLREWMAMMVKRFAPAFRFVTRELVCLEGHVQYNERMMCISAAYRVCLFLARIDDVSRLDETEEDFKNSTLWLDGEALRMLNWLVTNPDIAARRVTVLASRKLAQPFYELSDSQGFELYLMPYHFFAPVVPPAALAALASAGPMIQRRGALTDTKRIFDALDAARTPRLRYDPNHVFTIV